MAGLPNRARASPRASTQNPAARVFDRRQDRTRLVDQSRMATRYRNPRRIGIVTVASPEDLEAALQIETLTNDRVTETLARLARIDHSEWVIDQPGATLVMASFLHPATGGGR